MELLQSIDLRSFADSDSEPIHRRAIESADTQENIGAGVADLSLDYAPDSRLRHADRFGGGVHVSAMNRINEPTQSFGESHRHDERNII
jgi:hypothetical protein